MLSARVNPFTSLLSSGFPKPTPPAKMVAKLSPLLLKPLRFVPFDVQRRIIESVMSSMFQEAFDEGELGFLQGKWVSLEVTDLQLRWNITLGATGLILAPGAVVPDTMISGNSNDLLALAAQVEDPDTLFFQRRLRIEGDTELGLETKNILYSMEFSSRLMSLIQWYLQQQNGDKE